MTNWKQIKTITGPATRVPDQIGALSAKSLPERDQATKALSETLVRDGETSAAAAPALELLEPLVAAHAPGGHRAAWVLGEIFAADQLAALAGRAPVASAAREAVSAHADASRKAALAALASDDAAWRSGGAFALAFLPGSGEKELVTCAERDSEPAVRVSALLALGIRSRSEPKAKAVLEGAHADGLVSSAAVLARAIGGADVEASTLGRAAVAWWMSSVSQELMPWGRLSGATRLVEAVIAGDERRAAVAPDIAEALVALPAGHVDVRRSQIADLVLAWSTMTAKYADGRVASAEELNPTERRIAEAFASDDSVGLRGGGLPGSARAIARWLGKAPAGPLEAKGPSGRPRWVEARELIAKATPFDTILEQLTAGLDGRAKLDVYTELLRGAYRILPDGGGWIDPTVLEAAVAEAGPAGLDWAESLVRDVNALEDGIGDYNALHALVGEHVMVALLALTRQKTKLPPGATRLVALSPNLEQAREVLASIPAAERTAATLERFKAQPADNPSARGMFINEVLPVFDLLGSPELARAILAALEEPALKARGFTDAQLAPVRAAAG